MAIHNMVPNRKQIQVTTLANQQQSYARQDAEQQSCWEPNARHKHTTRHTQPTIAGATIQAEGTTHCVDHQLGSRSWCNANNHCKQPLAATMTHHPTAPLHMPMPLPLPLSPPSCHHQRQLPLPSTSCHHFHHCIIAVTIRPHNCH